MNPSFGLLQILASMITLSPTIDHYIVKLILLSEVLNMRTAKKALAALKLRPPVIDMPEQGACIGDLTIINPGMDRKSNQLLKVRGEKIDSIKDTGNHYTNESIDYSFSGCYALPGLIDMHVHYPNMPNKLIPSIFDMAEAFGPLFLYYGVTSVRDVGNFHKSIWHLRKKMNEGEFPAPRMFCCGPILDGEGGKMGDLSRILHGPVEACDFMAELAEKKADSIKVYDWLSPETMTVLRKEAERYNLPIVGHIPFNLCFEDSGVQDVQHLNGLQFQGPVPGFNFHNPKDFALYFNTLANVSDKRIDEIVRISADQGVCHTPTIVTIDRIARTEDNENEDYPSKYQMPRYVRDVCWSPEIGLQYLQGHSIDVLHSIKVSVLRIKEIVSRLKEAGVRIHTGSDGPFNPYTSPGVSLYEEMSHLVDSGYTPEEAWIAGTRHPGEFLGREKLGTLQDNAPADVLIFSEDPTRDLSCLKSLKAVIANGRLYTKEMLEEALVKHRTYFENFFYDSIMIKLIGMGMNQLE